ncbi:MAG: CRISPR-associated endonuclease Cas2, partial [Saprospiraceae bacterium]
MKYTWIIYDISNDKKRLALSRRCKHIGLLRVQKSVFLGQAQKKLLKELKKDASKYVLSPQDRVFFVPMTEE